MLNWRYKLKIFKRKYINYLLILIAVTVSIGLMQMAIDGTREPGLLDGWESYGTDDQSMRVDLLPGLKWSPYIMSKKAVESENRFVWFRYKMKSYIPEDSFLQLYLNDNSIEVYYKGGVAYSFGDMSQVGDRVSYGSPFHIVKIPIELKNQYVYVKMNSFFNGYSGIIRQCYLDNDTNLLINVLKADIDNLVISIVLIVSSFVAGLVFLLNGAKIKKAPFYLALAAFTTGVWMFSEMGIKQILYDRPRFWLYIAFIFFYLIPIGYIKFCVEIFDNNKFKKLLNTLVIINIIYLIFSLSIDVLKVKNIVYTLYPYLIFMGFEMAALISSISYSAYKGNKDADLFLIGIVVIILLTIYDIFGMILLLVPWSYLHISYGIFIFIFILLYILISQIQDMYVKEAANSIEIIAKNEEFMVLNNELEENRNHLIDVNLNLESIVSERTASLKNLLNNAGQGFLMFSKEMKVDSSCSSECWKIFDKDIRGLDYSELIHGDNKDSKNYLRNVLQTILQLPDNSYNERYLSLLPSEALYKNKILDLKYKIISSTEINIEKSCMVVITDITETKLMHKKIDEEEALMKNIVKVAAYTRDFIALTDSFRYFIKTSVPELFESKNLLLTKITILRKKIHYYKGSFGIFGFKEMLETLNLLDAVLREFGKDENLTLEKLMEEYAKFDLLILLNEIMNFVSRTLSMQFNERIDTVRVRISKINEIARKIEILPGGSESAKEIRRLTYREFFVLMAKYVVYTENLAEQLGKSIEPINIKGGKFLINLTKYEALTNSFVHIFRNAIDHGIEKSSDRVKAGKKAKGFVRCIIEHHKDRIWIIIEDDGKGIDYNGLKEKAIREGLLAEEDTTAENLTLLVLEGKVSTKEVPSEISGYGLGLSVVMDEVDKLNGRLEIDSLPGIHTRIFIDVPFFD